MLAFAHGFGFAEALDGAGAFGGDGDESAEGFERLARKYGAGNADAAERLHADADGDEAEAALGVEDGLFAIGGAAQFFVIEMGGAAAGAIKLIFVQEKNARRRLLRKFLRCDWEWR